MVSDPRAFDREVAEHRRSFDVFLSMIFFAAGHIALTLACIALAFFGGAHVMAWLIWLGGSVALLVAVVAHRAQSASLQPVRARGNAGNVRPLR